MQNMVHNLKSGFLGQARGSADFLVLVRCEMECSVVMFLCIREDLGNYRSVSLCTWQDHGAEPPGNSAKAY